MIPDAGEALNRRTHELRHPESSHAQPWLAELLQRARVHDWLTEQITTIRQAPRQYRLSPTLTRELKPNGTARDFALVPVEFDVAMILQATPLVEALEQVRRPVSFANPVVFPLRDYWTIVPFRDQRRPNGADGKYRNRKFHIRENWPFVAIGDVEGYFPSLQWGVISRGLAILLGCEEGDIQKHVDVLGRVRIGLRGRHPGLPVGPDLSRVIGTALLAPVDDLLLNERPPQAAARWVDDIIVGCRDPGEGWQLLQAIEGGPLARAGLSLNQAKTIIEPSASRPRAVSSSPDIDLPLDAQPVVTAHALPGEPTTLPRQHSRSIIYSRRGLDPEQEATWLADNAHRLLTSRGPLLRRLQAFVGAPLDERITDTLLCSLERNPPNSPEDGEVASAFLQLERQSARVGTKGLQAVRRMITDQNRCERTRVCGAWLLARRRGHHEPITLERLNEMSSSSARGMVAAAHVAGAKPHTFHWEQVGLVA